MADSTERAKIAATACGTPGKRLITIPAHARDEIGDLAFYLERMLQNLREVNDHLRGSSQTMPGVLHDLKDIVKMTEVATVRVLEETEALVEEGQAASALIADARREAESGAFSRVGQPLARAQALVDTASNRAMAIMSALEFQDLTSQRVHRTFEVLEEVVARLGKIRTVVDLGEEVEAKQGAGTRNGAAQPEGKSGQDLADELLLRFRA